MNKKIIFAAVMMFAAAALFAEAPYVVKSVTGTVRYEAAPGQWKAVVPGMSLAPSARVNTGFNSVLVLFQGGKSHSIAAMQKDTVEQLCAGRVASSRGGIRIGSKVSKSSVSSGSLKKRSSVSTASTRASDAAEEMDWEE